MDVLVSGVGTGGTITGVSRYIKTTLGKPLVSVAVEPTNSPVIRQTISGEALKPGPHKIQGIGAGFVPHNLDLTLLDRVESASDEEAVTMARRLMKEEGILAGISCGAAAAVAIRLAREEAYRIVQRHAHSAWNLPGGDFRANLEADADVSSRLSPAELAECFSTALHEQNLGVIWQRLGI